MRKNQKVIILAGTGLVLIAFLSLFLPVKTDYVIANRSAPTSAQIEKNRYYGGDYYRTAERAECGSTIDAATTEVIPQTSIGLLANPIIQSTKSPSQACHDAGIDRLTLVIATIIVVLVGCAVAYFVTNKPDKSSETNPSSEKTTGD